MPDQETVEDQETERRLAFGRAMKVAAALSNRRNDEFAKPGNLVEVKFVRGQSLSLTASRLLALMILAAAGDAWKPVAHRLPKSEIRRGHKGNERISDMLEELHRTLFAEDDLSWRGKKATRRFSLIQMSRVEADFEDERSGESCIEWEFTPDARRLIQESETYAVLNRRAILGFRSVYALKLYELGALRIYRRLPVWRVDMIALRAALGIDPAVYKDFAQLRRKVLGVAKAEIDQLAHFTVEWTEFKRGRTVVELEFRFVAKEAPEQIATVNELERHSSGRRARREGAVEVVTVSTSPAPTIAKSADTEVHFPGGSLRFGTAQEIFGGLARVHGGGWDVDIIAAAYRETMGERLEKLSGVKLKTSFVGFCQSFLARRGKP